MKKIDLMPLACSILALACFVTVGQAQNVHEHDHGAPHSETAAKKEYVIMQSWAHQKKVLVSKGHSEAEADGKILEWLTKYQSMDRAAGNDRIGLQAPPFQFDGWLNSEPLTVDDLKGHVVLIRWFTDTCPYLPAAPQLCDNCMILTQTKA